MVATDRKIAVSCREKNSRAPTRSNVGSRHNRERFLNPIRAGYFKVRQ